MKKHIACKTDGCRKWANLNKDGVCPACVSTPPPAAADDVDIMCTMCNQAIQDDHKTIGCDLCNKWFHSKCVGLDELVQ